MSNVNDVLGRFRDARLELHQAADDLRVVRECCGELPVGDLIEAITVAKVRLRAAVDRYAATAEGALGKED